MIPFCARQITRVFGAGFMLSTGLLLGAPVEAAPKDAQAAAEAWLAVVDGADYVKSWDDAAAYVKTVMPPDQWARSIQAARGPLGKVLSRKMVSSQRATQLPEAPAGEYVIIQYATTFERKAAVTETVTPMKDPDGVWRVAGYYLR